MGKLGDKVAALAGYFLSLSGIDAHSDIPPLKNPDAAADKAPPASKANCAKNSAGASAEETPSRTNRAWNPKRPILSR